MVEDTVRDRRLKEGGASPPSTYPKTFAISATWRTPWLPIFGEKNNNNNKKTYNSFASHDVDARPPIPPSRAVTVPMMVTGIL